MNSWIQLLARISSTIPLIIMGVEAIHQGASGADKKTIALQALGLSNAVAGAIAPSEQPSIDAATQFASSMIDTTVATFNQFNVFKQLLNPTPAVEPVLAPPSATPGVTTLQPPKA